MLAWALFILFSACGSCLVMFSSVFYVSRVVGGGVLYSSFSVLFEAAATARRGYNITN